MFTLLTTVIGVNAQNYQQLSNADVVRGNRSTSNPNPTGTKSIPNGQASGEKPLTFKKFDNATLAKGNEVKMKVLPVTQNIPNMKVLKPETTIVVKGQQNINQVPNRQPSINTGLDIDGRNQKPSDKK